MQPPPQQAYRLTANAPSAKRLWLIVAAAAAGMYLVTAQRGQAWQDSGIFQWRIHEFDLRGFMGLALAHPLLIVLGKCAGLVPLGPEPWRYNALSAIAGALAAANLALLVRRLAPKAAYAAYFAGGAFALAHSVWWLATITESYTIMVALMSGELLALMAILKRPTIPMVMLLGLLNGLGASTHNLALLALPAYGLAVIMLARRRRIGWRAVGLFVLAWCAGASLLLGLVIGASGQMGLIGAVRSALFGDSWRAKVLGGSGRAAVLGLGYVIYNFPNLALPLAGVGLWRLKRRLGALPAGLLAYIFAIYLIFAVRYAVPDQFMFFLPFYLVTSMLAGLGLAELGGKRRWLRFAAIISLAMGPAVYMAAPPAAKALGIRLPGSARSLPFRDNARYWLSPWKHNEDSAARFARETIRQLEALDGPAIVFADGTAHWPIRWEARLQHVDRARIRLVGESRTDMLEAAEADPEGFLSKARDDGASVFVVSNVRGYCPVGLLPYVQAEPTGMLYRVALPAGRDRRRTTSSASTLAASTSSAPRPGAARE